MPPVALRMLALPERAEVDIPAVHSGALGAASAAAAGQQTEIAFITAMARQAGWSKDIPEILRNSDWNYAAFNPDLSVRTAANQAECLACHKPLPQDSYLFSLKDLRETALKKK